MTKNFRFKKTFSLAVLAVFTFILLTGTVFAQDNSSSQPTPATASMPANAKITVLSVPMVITSDFKPLSKDQIQQTLEKYSEEYMPNADIIQSGDLPVMGDDFDIDDARKLAKDKNVNYVTWGTMAFKQSKTTVRSGPESPIYQYIVTVSGTADIKVYSAKADDIVIDQRMFQSENTTTRALEGSAKLEKVFSDCAVNCVKDLSQNLMKAVKAQEDKLSGK